MTVLKTRVRERERLEERERED